MCQYRFVGDLMFSSLVRLVAFLSIFCLYVQQATAITCHKERQISSQEGDFIGIVPKIKKGSSVPILLPAKLPDNSGKLHRYISGSSDSQSWAILVESSPDCHGTDACLVGYFGADYLPLSDFAADDVVKLANGIDGYYRRQSCGGSCTPPQIHWTYKQVHYTIQYWIIGDGEKGVEDLIVEMANSAIRHGVR